MKFLKKNVTVLPFLLLLCLNFSYAQSTNSLDCETGDKNADQILCWAFVGTTYTTTSAISGAYCAITNALDGGINSPKGIESPWLKFNATGTIKWKMKLDLLSSLFPRNFVLQKVDTNNVVVETLYSHTFNVLNSLTVTSPTVNINFTGVYKLRFYFYGLGGPSKALLDDILIDGEYWSNPSNDCKPKIIELDADNDGVKDANDAFPNDPTKAYLNYYPGTAGPGTLMFEDLWPIKGDYDLNDLVAEYKMTYVTNAQNNLVELQMKIVTKALGGANSNGLMYQLDGIVSNKILSVTGSKLTGSSWVNLSANGTESGQNFANIIIYDNGNKVMLNPDGNVTNVLLNKPYIRPDTTNILIKFRTDGSNATSGNSLKFNPYIVKNQERGTEIHLPKFAPSAKVNLANFKTFDDDSNPANNKYYQTVNNLPWALDISTTLPYPTEASDLTSAYTKFTQWVISDGNQFNDWFMDKPGYRVSGNLYIR